MLPVNHQVGEAQYLEGVTYEQDAPAQIEHTRQDRNGGVAGDSVGTMKGRWGGGGSSK